ncbi:hypothetical protein [Komagataeibacter xylinus]|uniref:hypothetical protein n=1 Tax=Komagataeibacter xylinus TaxID=28448 RepID=UPI00280BED91|nr:hypothetical protein [Komagataeibacter xylinus]
MPPPADKDPTSSGLNLLRGWVDDIAKGKGPRPTPTVYDRAAEAGEKHVENFFSQIAKMGGDMDVARSHAENIFCSGFNTYLDNENVTPGTPESAAELELAVMVWKSRNP